MSTQVHPVSRQALALRIAASRPALLGRARALVGRSEAEDLVQDTMERALRSTDRFAPGTNLYAWLSRILVNRGLDGLRQRRLRLRLLDQVAGEASAHRPAEGTGSPPITASELQCALQGMPAALREVLELRYHSLATNGEIARRLDIPPATAGTRLWRALKRLRRAVAPQV